MTPSFWERPQSILDAAAQQWKFEKWVDQGIHLEIMVEKEALAGVLGRVCSDYEITFTANKGYSSDSYMFECGQRILRHMDRGERVVVGYLGDHDPSGIDMTRDVATRLALFSEFWDYNKDKWWDTLDEWIADCATATGFTFEPTPPLDPDRWGKGNPLEIVRLGLNMDQIRRWNPPPNPAKETDSRIDGYIEMMMSDHGYKNEDEASVSWELDALKPEVLAALVKDFVFTYRDPNIWAASSKREREIRQEMSEMVRGFETKIPVRVDRDDPLFSIEIDEEEEDNDD